LVGAGITIFIQSNLLHQLRYTLHNRRSKNEAQQLIIVKEEGTKEKTHINDNIPRKLTVHTDSRITFQSLRKQKITITA
jgi:hypothetical protein